MCAWSDVLVWILTRGPSWAQVDRVGRADGAVGHVAEERRDAVEHVRADRPGNAGDHARRAVPAVEVVQERLAARPADGLLRADDVPAERLVAVEEVVVDAVHVVARRVVVHVHLLDDHALLALDLLGVELRVAEHVDEDVERSVPVLGGALDVVARVLLAGEGVELAPDGVDLARDVARRRTVRRPLEEHVLGEVRDAVGVLRLVAGARREHHEAGDRLRLGHVSRHDPRPFGSVVFSKVFVLTWPQSSSLRRRRGGRASPRGQPWARSPRSRRRRARTLPRRRAVRRRRGSRAPCRSSCSRRA